MVTDCLQDDFRSFLDPREYRPLGKRGAGAGHARYSDLRLPGRWPGFTFLHHDPSRKRQAGHHRYDMMLDGLPRCLCES
ncbi:MMK1 [Symbiodinium natans]|uniref:MMK1 protein n=1 Tax=Symbiodinium natans TaxID=878477 RepID=A0A812KIA2_9DINO|nr:MMK1 [Symbiodinium natans]